MDKVHSVNSSGKFFGKLILVIWILSASTLATAATDNFIWTGGTCCGQNQPQFIHNPQALVNYFVSTPLPVGSPRATTFPSYTTCLSPPTALGQSCYVYAWYTNIPYTSTKDDCPVPELLPLTDPVALQYDDGTYSSKNPDIDHLTPATQAGLACIQQKVAALNCYMSPKPTSGYRPTAYQTHLLDVYDKWQLIKDNNSTACADRKTAIEKEFDKHSTFARRPGVTSNHSQLDAQGNPAGNAVDISPVPDDANISADAIACQCNMYRPLINMPNPKDNDPVHYQSRTCHP